MKTPLSRPTRWRIVSLAAVHVLIAAHILHWRLAGTSLTSVQLSEAGRFAAEGVVTAAAVLFASLLVSTAIFGRFFCAWGCHMLALQEACAFLLRRCGIEPKLVRSRTLWLVPSAGACMIYLQPLVARWWNAQPFPDPVLRWSGDDLWANLPGAGIGAATFVVCGLFMVWLLGSLSFCRYVCPYGALFAVADRLAPGRIRSRGECDGCARCTAACTTGVRVHEEILRSGAVNSAACMRCFECVSACPRRVLAYRLGPPAIGARRTPLAPHLWSFSLPEEAAMLGLCTLAFAALDGLYDAVPLLLALSAGVLFGYLGVLVLRLAREPFVAVRGAVLKRSGRTAPAGRAVLAGAALALAAVLHALVVQVHVQSARGSLAALSFPRLRATYSRDELESARSAVANLTFATRWGAIDTAEAHMELAWLHRLLRRPSLVEHHLERAIALEPGAPAPHFNLARELRRQGREREAAVAFAEAVRLAPELARHVR